MNDVTITALKLQQLSRRCDYTALAPRLQKACAGNGITAPAEVAAFVATCCVESQGLTVFAESLNYTVEALLAKFGRHRISEADARRLGRIDGVDARGAKVVVRKADQQAIANLVYGGAWGAENLGNTEPGDGWRFRGLGPGQVTGRANMAALEKAIGLPLLAHPELLADPAHGFEASARLWKAKRMGQLVYGPPEALRRAWNGGLNGLAEYKGWLVQTRNILGA
ncbi:glycoside hydrolase family 19 protein [Caulobacter sp. BK020]|uniref:glycoside hydrolase family 19 protein n=1 Tax=Caulobacter sp. BK020 TaxID=2512117 RepID=UPI001051C03A|nr:glycoside hydrolase family 19 protein [Caulobacter sp. BK020]TCS14534.1 putative chitinase [Caulobacter sp. BK020]